MLSQSYELSRTSTPPIDIPPSIVIQDTTKRFTEEDDELWKSLDITNLELKLLSPNISIYTHLTELNLNNNQLSVLPIELFNNLTNLTHLDLSFNNFQWVQPQISNLIQLKALNFNHNTFLRELPTEMGKLFRLEKLHLLTCPIIKPNQDIINKGTSAVIAHLRDLMPTGERPPEREWVERTLNMGIKTEGIRILNYNILAESYANIETLNYCPNWALKWSYRKGRILKEIVDYKADIICLQEVEAKQYHSFLKVQLKTRGYDSIYYPKSRAKTMKDIEKVDGCAIFWQRETFKFIAENLIEYQVLCFQKHGHIGTDAMERLMTKDNIAVSVLLQPMGKFALSNNGSILVVNTHIHWDPIHIDVKAMQVQLLIEEVERIISTHSSSFPKIPVILAGDFNSVPSSAVYKLLTTSKVEKGHQDFQGYNYGHYTERGLSHNLSLSSSYGEVLGQEPEYTNYTGNFVGVLDYIWYSNDYFTAKKVLKPLTETIVKSHNGALPNPWMCSDHIPLIAEIHEKTNVNM